MTGDGGDEPWERGPRAVAIYLLRHAHAGDPLAWKGSDADRPLSSRGRKQTERLGRFLQGVGFKPDAIISSPLVRAMQTAEGLAARLHAPVLIDYRLAEDIDLEGVETILATAGDPRRPVLVGHDPAFSALVATLTGLHWFAVAKGTLVRIDADRPLRSGEGLLRWVVPPDLLKAERPER